MKHPRLCSLVHGIVVLLTGVTILHADIQNSHGDKPRVKKQHQARAMTIQLVPKVVAQVVRGESVDISIEVTPFRPGATSVKILIPPHHGTLTQVDNDPGKAAVMRYVHDREYSDEEETFTFLVTDSQLNPSGTKQTGRILIRNPHATLVFTPEDKLDFGTVPLGKTVCKKVTLSNVYGSTISGALRVAPPWRIEDDPFVVLHEGDSKTFTISFTPKADGGESSRLSWDPDTVSLPQMILQGSGQAPFEMASPGMLKITKDSPKAPIILRNTTDQEITVAWRGESSGLEISPPVTIPSKGTAEAWILSHIEMLPDTIAKRTLKLSCAAYSLPVKLEIKGPKGGVSLELLRGGETLRAIRGEESVLEGVVRNSSQTERQLDIRIENPEGETRLPSKHLVIPPQGFANFQFAWSPGKLGDGELPVLVTEENKVVAENHWQVRVSERVRSTTPVPTKPIHSPSVVSSTNAPQGGIYLASDKFKAKLAVDLRPIEERGILMSHLVLEWNYYGPEKTVFVVEEKHHANALTDRMGDETASVWKPVTVKVETGPGGSFSIRIPMPLPGKHEYRVYPAGHDHVLIAPVTLEVSHSMFWWPWIRSLFLLLFLLTLVKFVLGRL